MTALAAYETVCKCEVCAPPILMLLQGVTAETLENAMISARARVSGSGWSDPIIIPSLSFEPVTITQTNTIRNEFAAYLVGLLDPGWEA